jgi:UDP-glucose:(heptosyl)LPS alpha-1,3-glucosyltransferase
MQKMGCDVRICAERVDLLRLKQQGLQWFRVPRLPINSDYRRRFFDWFVKRYIAIIKPDLFISHNDACSDDILVIHNCAALAHERIHGSAPPENNALIRFQQRIIRKSRYRYLIANSELMKRDLTLRYGLEPSRVVVFYQGVDTALFNTVNHQEFRHQGRIMLRLPDQAYLAGLITSGAFQKRNVRFFLEVAASVWSYFPEMRFVVVGKDRSIEWYRNYAKQLGLENVVTFAPPVENVELYYHALDVFVYPAKIEEYGRVVLEALACGTPAIVGAAVGASEIMKDDGVPTILEGWNVEEWAGEIISHLKHPPQAQANAEKGVMLAEKYSQRNRARAMEALLKRWVNLN